MPLEVDLKAITPVKNVISGMYGLHVVKKQHSEELESVKELRGALWVERYRVEAPLSNSLNHTGQTPLWNAIMCYPANFEYRIELQIGWLQWKSDLLKLTMLLRIPQTSGFRSSLVNIRRIGCPALMVSL